MTGFFVGNVPFWGQNRRKRGRGGNSTQQMFCFVCGDFEFAFLIFAFGSYLLPDSKHPFNGRGHPFQGPFAVLCHELKAAPFEDGFCNLLYQHVLFGSH